MFASKPRRRKTARRLDRGPGSPPVTAASLADPSSQKGDDIMAIRDLIPWSRQENRLPVPVSAERDRGDHPLLSLHRDVNRLFDDVFRGFGLSSIGGFGRELSWPNLEFGETDTEVRVIAELQIGRAHV